MEIKTIPTSNNIKNKKCQTKREELSCKYFRRGFWKSNRYFVVHLVDKKIKRSNKRCGCKLTFISLLKRMLNLENHGEQGRKKKLKGKGNNMKCWKIMIFVDDWPRIRSTVPKVRGGPKTKKRTLKSYNSVASVLLHLVL